MAADDAMLGAVFLREARAAVPAGLASGDRPRGAGHPSITRVATGAVSVAAQSLTREVLKAMLLQKLTIASRPLCWVPA